MTHEQNNAIRMMTDQGVEYGSAVHKLTSAYAKQCKELVDNKSKFENAWSDFIFVHATQIALGLVMLQMHRAPKKFVAAEMKKLSDVIRRQLTTMGARVAQAENDNANT